MAARVKKHFDILRVLQKANPKLHKAILQNADTDVVHCICDCTHNALNGNLKLTPKQKKQLVKFKKPLRQLTVKKVALKKKRNLLIQHGGLVSAVLAPLLAVAASLLADTLMKK